MKKGLTEIVIVLDESGSMHHGKRDTIGSFNEFLETQQKLPGYADFTLVKFSDYFKVVDDGVSIKLAVKLNEENYTPSSSTALLDAVGKTIAMVKKRISEAPENEIPEKVIFAVITDGEENSSKEFKLDVITSLVKEMQEEHGWEFLFLGADIEAWGNDIGIHTNISFSKDDMSRSMKGMSYYTANYRAGDTVTMGADNFSLSEDQLDQELNKLTNSK